MDDIKLLVETLPRVDSVLRPPGRDLQARIEAGEVGREETLGLTRRAYELAMMGEAETRDAALRGIQAILERADHLEEVAIRFRERIQSEVGKNLALQETVRHDDLTGVLNRAPLMVEGARLQAEAAREGVSFVVLFIDIDHFKRVNDVHGHACGDSVLQKVGAQMNVRFRPGDVAGRYGGEEFMVCMKVPSLSTAEDVAERFRRYVENYNFQHEGSSIPITISVGVALAEKDESLSGLIKKADAAMYKAKNGGRNAVVSFRSPEDPQPVSPEDRAQQKSP